MIQTAHRQGRKKESLCTRKVEKWPAGDMHFLGRGAWMLSSFEAGPERQVAFSQTDRI
jgi:hypothetical protein